MYNMYKLQQTFELMAFFVLRCLKLRKNGRKFYKKFVTCKTFLIPNVFATKVGV